MNGSKRTMRKSWRRGRTTYSLRGELKRGIKLNKKYLNRKARYHSTISDGCAYKKIGKRVIWKCVS